MLTPRLTNCPECADIPNLLKRIDCKLAEYANGLYNNISFMLNQTVPARAMIQLLAYKRILTYKQCNPDYLIDFCTDKIVSKVIRLTSGCYIKPIFIPTPTTSTTSTSTTCPSGSTTTTSSSSSTSTTSSTSTSSTSTTTSTSSSTTTSSTTIVTYSSGFSVGTANNLLGCAETVPALTLYSNSPTFAFGSFVYTDPGLTTVFVGGNLYYKNISANNLIRVPDSGQINSTVSC